MSKESKCVGSSSAKEEIDATSNANRVGDDEDDDQAQSQYADAGHKFLVPGATVADMLMLGIFHARRLCDDKKNVDNRKEEGIDPEFSPNVKASFMKLLHLRSTSRFWGRMMKMQIQIFLHPTVYKAGARAFHSDLEEAALPLENYASLQRVFLCKLKEGS